MTTVKYFVNANWDTGNDKCQNQTDREVGYEELNSRIKEFEKAGNHGSMHVRSEKQVYHVSSNGYYGYLPIMNEPTEELEMDTNDDDTVIMRNEIGTGVNSASPTDDKSKSGLSFGISLGRRKRMNVENNSLDFSKKQRIEEFCGLSPCQVTVPPTPRSSDVHYPRCIMGHYV
ncbi:hypothetical protein C0J52_10247 [Blattella germanica]|nr:hypothetical protein C0J52_10247 [Blattella germanica]